MKFKYNNLIIIYFFNLYKKSKIIFFNNKLNIFLFYIKIVKINYIY